MKKRVFCFLLTVFIICAFSINSFAFGTLSFDDEFMQKFTSPELSTSGFPGYHIYKDSSHEVVARLRTCQNASSYVGSTIVYLPVIQRYAFFIKQTEEAYFYDISTSHYRAMQARAEYIYNDQVKYGYRVTFGWYSLLPYRITLGNYTYICFLLFWGSDTGFYNGTAYAGEGNYSVNKKWSVQRAEKEQLETAFADAGITDMAGFEVLDPDEEVPDTTGPVVDEASESEKYSKEFLKIDEMISNIDDFSDMASSNLVEVSSALGDMRNGVDLVLGMFPKLVIALMILGLVMIIVVKIIGR